MTTCVVEPQSACLPVTALCSVSVDGVTLLLAGQGPLLRIHDVNGTSIHAAQVFEVQPVLGIRVRQIIDHEGHPCLLILAWGGSWLRFGHLTYTQDSSTISDGNPDTVWSNPHKLSDWALDAVFHHGSIFVLNAHNQLVELAIPQTDDEKPSTNLIVDGPRSFLYSGCIFVAESGSIILASGTIFGEVLVWTWDKKADHQTPTPSLHYVFQGHTGSIFGVSISETFTVARQSVRLLASCSDDRTVKLWDISNVHQPDIDTRLTRTSNETGFGPVSRTDQTYLVSEWGHLSRVWDVAFIKTSEHGRFSLLSRGEDGVCQLWTIELSGDATTNTVLHATLVPKYRDRHHFGKNAWSICQLHTDQGTIVFTGGADGHIISRKFEVAADFQSQPLTITLPFKAFTPLPTTLKHYLLLKHDECLATTDQGQLFRLTTADGNLRKLRISQTPSKGGLILCAIDELFCTIVAQQRGGLSALLHDQEALMPISSEVDRGISWMQMAGPHSKASAIEMAVIVAVYSSKDAAVLWVSREDDSIDLVQTTLTLPEGFLITACHYDQSTTALILGSRSGSLAVYSGLTPQSTHAGSSYCLRHVHGTDSVTSISVLHSGGADHGTYILTTGRDGNYIVHRFVTPVTATERPQVSIVHLSSPPFGPNIEGAYFTASGDDMCSEQPQLILYGFRSTSFVVWNESQQSEVFSVDCGGAHRSWSYKDNSASTASTTVKCFVWTKAGAFNWHTSHGSNHRVVQSGGHGREIKAVARSPGKYRRNQVNRTLVATGAEDTNIHIFAVAPTAVVSESDYTAQTPADIGTTYEIVATLKQHTTGIQHLQFSCSGEYLFSSAGCEEFYAWKLTHGVPFIAMGSVWWDVMPTEEEDADSRIMSFDLCSDVGDSEDNYDDYIIAMAYSNGRIKVVRYTPAPIRRQDSFETLRIIDHGSFCLMQAVFLSSQQPNVSPSGLNLLSAGTNGHLNLSILDEGDTGSSGVSHAPVATHKIHQSSILALDLAELNSGEHLVATGGDDNAINLTLLQVPTPDMHNSHVGGQGSGSFRPEFSTILIPHAHAAAVTAAKVVKTTSTSFLVVTASNDQRVKVWRVNINHGKIITKSPGDCGEGGLLEAMQVELVGSAWTAVADVSGLEVLDQHTRINGTDNDSSANLATDVMIVGVGMEVLRVAHNHTAVQSQVDGQSPCEA